LNTYPLFKKEKSVQFYIHRHMLNKPALIQQHETGI